MCERCGAASNLNNPLINQKEIPDKPVEIVHGYLILHPDLMEPFTFYHVEWNGQKLKVWKTICAVELLKAESNGLILDFKPAKILLGQTRRIGNFIVAKPSLGVVSIMRVEEDAENR